MCLRARKVKVEHPGRACRALRPAHGPSISAAMRPIPFHKMHGLGNDFVVIDERQESVSLSPAQILRIADRHRGVGFDQLIRVERAANADARLVFLNADGSEAGACGNGTRCAARLLMDELGRDALVLDSPAGFLPARRAADGQVTVEMPPPRLDWQDIPLAVACDTLEVPLELEGLPRPVAVSMGNPHAVFFVPDLGAIDVARLGALLERHPIFPDRANIGFAQVQGRQAIRLRVFERGAGLTLACGSGACAALVAAVRRGLVSSPAALILDGGSLEIDWDGEGPVLMTGPTALSFSGALQDELLGA